MANNLDATEDTQRLTIPALPVASGEIVVGGFVSYKID